MEEITQKLSDISMTMGDAYHFVNMRFMMEDMAQRAAAGDVSAQGVVDIVTRFHKLCELVNPNEKVKAD